MFSIYPGKGNKFREREAVEGEAVLPGVQGKASYGNVHTAEFLRMDRIQMG